MTGYQMNLYQNSNITTFKNFFNSFIELYIIKCKKISSKNFITFYINKPIMNGYIKSKYNKSIYIEENYINKDIELLLNILFEETIIALEHLNLIIPDSNFLQLLNKIIIINEELFNNLHLRNKKNNIVIENNIILKVKEIEKLKRLLIL